jgi:CheY-like chemotaxis protein
MPKILIAEDDDLVRQYLATLLERGGFEVCAVDGRIALSLVKAEREHFDAVITDLYMPDVDGIEIVMALRGKTRRVPVIGITAGGTAADDPCVVAMRRLGAAAVLQKPIDQHELFVVLSRVLGAKQAARDEATGAEDAAP